MTVGYGVVMLGAAWARSLSPGPRWRATVGSLALMGLAWYAPLAPPLVRSWLPMAFIGLGYFLSGQLFNAPMTGLEAWLIGVDRRWFGDPTERFAGWPAWLVGYLDIVYTLTFLLLPAGGLAVMSLGRPELLERYWAVLVAAEFGSFVTLAVIQTRPPWALERAAHVSADRVHALSAYFVQHGTIRANTFPSGHTAGTLAIALVLLGAWPMMGGVFLALSLSVAVACVVGRYHYAVDVILGAALAVTVWGAALAAGL